jgi:hypothetical protein
MDEKGFHHFIPIAKQWKHPGSLPLKKAKAIPSAAKVI